MDLDAVYPHAMAFLRERYGQGVQFEADVTGGVHVISPSNQGEYVGADAMFELDCKAREQAIADAEVRAEEARINELRAAAGLSAILWNSLPSDRRFYVRMEYRDS